MVGGIGVLWQNSAFLVMIIRREGLVDKDSPLGSWWVARAKKRLDVEVCHLGVPSGNPRLFLAGRGHSGKTGHDHGGWEQGASLSKSMTVL